MPVQAMMEIPNVDLSKRLSKVKVFRLADWNEKLLGKYFPSKWHHNSSLDA